MSNRLLRWGCVPAFTAAFLPNVGLLILRVGISISMLYGHGWSKLMGMAQASTTFPDPLGIGRLLSWGLATFAEVGCSLLLILGLATRLSTVPLMITMAVAAWILNGDSPFIQWEKPFVFLLIYVALFFTGSGRYAVDAWLHRRATPFAK